MSFKIKNHKLLGAGWSPSKNVGNIIKPKYLIVHYTAGRSFERSLSTLTKRRSKGNVSAHLLIGRDGRVSQLVPFNREAYHAGKSQWGNLQSLNKHSIGIELENFGKLSQRRDGTWVTYFNQEVPDSEVLVAKHKFGTKECGWHMYTAAQLETLEDVAELLFDRYDLEDVLGHDDIAPNRKQDPGPAFPMNNLKSLVSGRSDVAIDWTLFDHDRPMLKFEGFEE